MSPPSHTATCGHGLRWHVVRGTDTAGHTSSAPMHCTANFKFSLSFPSGNTQQTLSELQSNSHRTLRKLQGRGGGYKPPPLPRG